MSTPDEREAARERRLPTVVRPVAAEPEPTGLERWLPGVHAARTYRRAFLRHDLVAGLVLAALLVPQGMAYAELAGLPPVTGVYATLVPLLVYALVGPSRVLVLGPDSAVSPLIAAAILPLAAPGDPGERVALGGLLALLVGAIMLLGAAGRLGIVTELLAKPVRIGYLAGIALVVVATQLPKLLGFPVDGEGLIDAVRGLVRGIDALDWTALAVGGGCLAAILVGKRLAPWLPVVLLCVIGATVATELLDLAIPVLGPVPAGLPAPTLPTASVGDLGELVVAAAGIALIAFADTSVLSRSMAGHLRYQVDQDRELGALGAANLVGGLFQGFPISSSSSRTAVALSAGARTQLAGVVAALALGVVLLVATGLVDTLPTATLAAVVMAAVVGVVDVAALRRLYRVRRSEFLLALASLVGVAVAGVLWGILIAVGLSLLDVVRRHWRPHDAILVRVVGLKGYHDLARHPEGDEIPGLVLYRFDAPLFFANADHFREHVRDLVERGGRGLRRIVIAAEPITDVDTTAAEMLEELVHELRAVDVQLELAELKGHVRDRLAAYGLVDLIGRERFHPTLGVAVRAYLDETGTSWVDWEDR